MNPTTTLPENDRMFNSYQIELSSSQIQQAQETSPSPTNAQITSPYVCNLDPAKPPRPKAKPARVWVLGLGWTWARF